MYVNVCIQRFIKCVNKIISNHIIIQRDDEAYHKTKPQLIRIYFQKKAKKKNLTLTNFIHTHVFLSEYIIIIMQLFLLL